MEGFPSVGLIASKLWILNDDLLDEEKKKQPTNQSQGELRLN